MPSCISSIARRTRSNFVDKKNVEKRGFFKIIGRDRLSRARIGVLKTLHGTIRTPSYVIVATDGMIRTLKPSDVKKTGTQVVISNTYHLWQNKQIQKIKRAGGLHRMFRLPVPSMTDSGGFQVFSLGFAREHGISKFINSTQNPVHSTKKEKNLVKITNNGARFKVGNTWHELTPELSMQLQRDIGADIMFAFDECTSPLHNFSYNKKAMLRTHRWALRCLRANTLKPNTLVRPQLLFGIIQGGKYKSLRIASAKYIASLPFDGFGIGGAFGSDFVSGKAGGTKSRILDFPDPMGSRRENREGRLREVEWVVPYLPEDKPRHLLGVGRIEDIFTAVENGIDLFDCVIPTREARHGKLWTSSGPLDIRKGKFAKDKRVVEIGCKCPVCSKKISRFKIRGLFKTKDGRGSRLATLHNVWFFNNLLVRIRRAIAKGKFQQFKHSYLSRFH